MLFSVEKTWKFDSSTDCSDVKFAPNEASLYQVLYRTTTENSATNTMTERIRSVAGDRKKI